MLTTVLEQCYIAPTPSVPTSSLPLTFFDIGWLYRPPVERLFFFPCPDDEVNIPNLKSSLSRTLHHYFPLAGRARPIPGSTDDRYEVHYAEGDTVSFTLAKTELDFLDLVSNRNKKYDDIRSLVCPLLGGGLLAIQLTLFPGRGLCICFTVHHVACDGVSSVRFIKSWASYSKSKEGILSPLLDRSLIPDPDDFYSEKKKMVVPSRTEGLPTTDKVRATFTLRRDNVDALKELMGEKRVSTFVVSCAYMWVCLVKAKGYEPERKVHFLFSVDWRKRFQPQVPTAYFGNCLTPCIVEANACELVGDNGVVVASEVIGRAIGELKEISEEMRGSSGRLRTAIVGGALLSVAGSPKFGVYKVDFGWGPPAKVEVPSVEKTGAMSLAESREGDDGVEIGIVLPEREMNALATNFDKGLKFQFYP